jgi:cytochrome c-type biogenesis protein CcmH/NrfG
MVAVMLRRALTLVAVVGCFAGCASHRVDARTLHYVDGELVSSRPISPRGYEAYLRARLALESDPPQLEHAAAMIDIALQLDPQEPHLWLTSAEVEERSGDMDAALTAVRRALELRPEYAPAQEMLVRLGGAGVASAGVGRP